MKKLLKEGFGGNFIKKTTINPRQISIGFIFNNFFVIFFIVDWN